MRIVLLGDSHFARVQSGLERIGGPNHSVDNYAVGGSVAVDLADQVAAADLGLQDVVVVSIGTNDAAGWRPIDRESFAETLGAFLKEIHVARLVVVTSPGTDEGRIGDTGPGFPPEPIAAYAEAAARIAAAVGAIVLDAAAVLAPVGGRAFVDDGVHLTSEAYDVLLPAIAQAVGVDAG